MFPLVIVTYACVQWIWRLRALRPVEYFVAGGCYALALLHLLMTNSLPEAILLGCFGIVSLFYGQLFKTKSALFLGGFLLLLSVLFKTKAFWLSIQWWVYLAVAGIILVVTASVNEYRKNRGGGLRPTFERLRGYLRDWD